MKNFKSVFIGLAVLVLMVGLFRYTLANIVFPNSFTSGTTASASQVNANFAAINTRQTATATLMAGTWNFVESGAFGTSASVYSPICSVTGFGTITLLANGSVSMTEQGIAFCPGSAPSTFNNGTVSGTYSVSANGSGTINITGGAVVGFQVSKDLNQAFFATVTPTSSGTSIITSGTATRQ